MILRSIEKFGRIFLPSFPPFPLIIFIYRTIRSSEMDDDDDDGCFGMPAARTNPLCVDCNGNGTPPTHIHTGAARLVQRYIHSVVTKQTTQLRLNVVLQSPTEPNGRDGSHLTVYSLRRALKPPGWFSIWLIIRSWLRRAWFIACRI